MEVRRWKVSSFEHNHKYFHSFSCCQLIVVTVWRLFLCFRGTMCFLNWQIWMESHSSWFDQKKKVYEEQLEVKKTNKTKHGTLKNANLDGKQTGNLLLPPVIQGYPFWPCASLHVPIIKRESVWILLETGTIS